MAIIKKKYEETDSRIRIISRENSGINLLSKRSFFFLANGEYIARMYVDADDIAYKVRFVKQMDYITKYGYDVVGTNLEHINSHGKIIDIRLSQKAMEVLGRIYYKCIISHPSCNV
ncbi:glycosyltransferase family protein [Francisella persica]|uniref:hypothetical protein n=1 Tax=Francisella persica TaxID=954 RepID=UPI0007DB5002|nr:hypothetical protein [Francisella persica]